MRRGKTRTLERKPVRAVVLTAGGLIGGGFAFLGVLILVMGEAKVPVMRGADYSAFGLVAYAMGIAWLGLGISLFCMGLLGAELGPKYYVRKSRDAAFLVFGAGLVAAVMLAIVKEYGNLAL
jgi:hypothetical protein